MRYSLRSCWQSKAESHTARIALFLDGLKAHIIGRKLGFELIQSVA